MPQEKVSKTKTSIWAIKCPYCSTTFQDLRVHLVTDKVSPSTKSSSRVNCNYCDLVISNPTCMKRHEEKVHGGLYSGISCQECNIAFYDYNDLKTHKNLCHNAGVEANVERYQHESEVKNDNLDEDVTSEEEAGDVAEAADETSSQFHENLASSTLPDGADSQGSSQGLDNEVKEEENLKITVNEDDNRNPTSSVVKSWGKPWGWVTSEGTPRFPNAQICNVCQKVFNKRDTKKYFLEHLKKCQKFYQFAIEGEMCSFCHKNDFLSYGRLLGHIETEHQEDIKKDNVKENINKINVLEKSPGSSPDRVEIRENSDEDNENIVLDGFMYESDQISGELSSKISKNDTSHEDQYLMDADGLNITKEINVGIQNDFQEIECDFCGVLLTDLEGHDCINEKNDEENDAEEESTNIKVRILKKGYIYL